MLEEKLCRARRTPAGWGGRPLAEEDAVPVNLPASSGRTSATALDAPVLVGMMFWPTPRPGGERKAQSVSVGLRGEEVRARGSDAPSRTLFLLYPSRTGCDDVEAWIVVSMPVWMPNSSLRTLASGARQLVCERKRDEVSLSSSRGLEPSARDAQCSSRSRRPSSRGGTPCG